MKYQIKKKKVIEAILTEPLMAGEFFGGSYLDNGECSVCAVGAILRATKSGAFGGCDAESVTGYLFSAAAIVEAWESENFMSILSCEFETAGLGLDIGTYQDENLPRFHALMIAEGMCPDVLEFEV